MNYYDKILRYTPALFQRPVTLALLRAAAASLDEAEAARKSIALGLVMETATGLMLDRFGDLYQVPRGSFDDDEYRDILIAFRAAHASHGEREALIRVLLAVLSARRVITIEAWPAGISFEVDGAVTTPERVRLMWLALDRAVNSGITLVGVRATPDPDAPYFGWRDDPLASGFDVGQWREFL